LYCRLDFNEFYLRKAEEQNEMGGSDEGGDDEDMDDYGSQEDGDDDYGQQQPPVYTQ
jgi:hypothetical protein